jgi:tetratricopeptide (TPR) repeat protein
VAAVLAAVVTAAVAGCGDGRTPIAPAQQAAPQSQPAAATPAAAPLPARALVKLADLQPPTTAPANPPLWDKLDDRTEPMVLSAEQRLRNREYAQAAGELERAAGFEPDNARIRRDLGLAYAGLPNYGKAFDNLHRAVKTAPDDLEAQLWIGRILAAQGRWSEAALALRTALATSAAKPADPRTGEAMLHLADALQQDGYWTASLEAMNTLSRLLREHEDTYRENPLLRSRLLKPETLLKARGKLMLQLRQYAGAAELLRQAYDMNQADIDSAGLLTRALAESGELPAAEKLMLRLVEQPAIRPQAAQLAAVVVAAQLRGGDAMAALTMTGRLVAAETSVDWGVRGTAASAWQTSRDVKLAERFAAGIKPGGEEFAMRYVAGVLADVMDQRSFANRQLELALKARGDFLPAYEAMIDIALAENRPDRVADLIDRASKAGGDTYFAWYLKGKVELSRGNAQQAVTNLLQSRSRNAQHAPTLVLLAEAYERSGQRSEAANSLLEAIAGDADSPDVYRRLYRLYADGRRWDEAQAVCDKYVQRYGLDADALLMQAELHLATGRPARAREALAEAQRQYPRRSDVRLLALQLQYGANAATMPADGFDALTAQLADIVRADPNFAPAKQRLAEALAARGRHAQAGAMFAELYAATRQSDVAKACAAAWARAREWKKLDAFLRQRLADEPSDASAKLMLISVAQKQGEPKRAAELATKFLKEAPDETARRDYRLALLRIHEDTKQYDAAQVVLDEWLAVCGDESVALGLRRTKLLMYEKAKQFDKAMDFAGQWMTRRPREAMQARALLMSILMRSHLDPKLATSALTMVDKWAAAAKNAGDEPALRSYRTFRIVLDGKAGNVDAARDEALAWVKEAPLEVLPRELAVTVLVDADRPDDAVALLDAWLKELGPAAAPATAPADVVESKSPQLAQGELARWCQVKAAMVLIHAGKYEAAVKRCDGYLKGAPADEKLLLARSAAQQENGDFRGAIDTLTRIYDANPRQTSINNNLAYAFADSGVQLARAEAMIRLALRAKPDEPAFMDTLGWVLYKQGRFEAAREPFERVLALAELGEMDHPVIFDHAGDCYWRLGEKDLAAEMWAKALELAKDDDHPQWDVRAVLKNAAAKLAAVKAGKTPPLAPLGEKLPATAPATMPAAIPAGPLPASDTDDDSAL